MRDLHTLDRFRVTDPAMLKHVNGWAGDRSCGIFVVPSPVDRQALRIVASSDLGWDHVSVSRRTRCPNWPEMAHVKSLFFTDEETAMELHVPKSMHVNNHPFCLHLWRPWGESIPLPPSIFVGVASAGVLDGPEAAQRLRREIESAGIA